MRALALVLVLGVGCAAKLPPPPQEPVVVPPPPPVGASRLPSSIGCESSASAEVAGQEVEDAVRAHAAEIEACYTARLSMRPVTEGRVVARLAIAPSGAVKMSCVVRSSLNDAAIDRCIIDRLLTWKFTARDAGGWVIVDHPFVFRR